ncbi:hypothetical protein [Streptomyces sp. NPDC051677]|uniref:hypothetical protein n=1 Tax=Streptomyces sp. NPDC051677 TaxID=3365669 RepID=UPI0037D79613
MSDLVDVIWHDERREEQAELLRQMRAKVIDLGGTAGVCGDARARHSADLRTQEADPIGRR